ncbi:MAG: cyclic 2,3-diphosphoglycerate synthase, partial [Chloroflexota bacterium]|nr:cyclic 2,3-diphosphoglycerate synthase [Chloroflexota bacterium]
NFNAYFRANADYEVVAFTATQIPNIENRRYPPELAGSLYPEGIPIHPEAELDDLIRRHKVDQVIFAYSDVPHEYVMHKASQVVVAGADFRLMGAGATMLESKKPVAAVCAVRTGCGKSQTTRHVCDLLQQMGKRVVVIRHPMPYGDLAAQAVQRFADYDDLTRHKCTIEEREEYEPHIDRGVIVYAGVDYEAILRQAEEETDVVVWDGGNNDLPFYKPDLFITVADPHRAGHELRYYPGEANLRAADVVLINKIDTAGPEGIAEVRESIQKVNPQAVVVDGASPIFVDDPEAIRGQRVLVIEDGPTLTHGGMTFGAGVVAARKFGAAELVDPRPFAVRSIAATFEKYPHTGTLLPAMGYGEEQVRDLEETINATECDLVLAATPIDLRRILNVRHPMDRVRYELQVIGRPTLEEILKERLG